MLLKSVFLYCIVIAAPALASPFLGTETFNGLTGPSGWLIQGEENGSHTTPGTSKTDTDYFGTGSGFGYLRLTEDAGYQRASAFYTDQTFRADQAWTLDWSVRIGKTHDGSEILNGADGLTVCFIDASTVDSSNGLSELLGGYGEWIGAPRGGPSNSQLGYYAGLEGWSFEFDHYQNSNELFAEYTHMVNLNDWTHLPGANHNFESDTSFYYNDGWQDVRLAYDGNGQFSFYWGSGLANSYSWTNLIASGNYYLGFSAATGGQTAYHEIDNVNMDATVPEPSSAFLFMGGALVLGLLRKRRVAAD